MEMMNRAIEDASDFMELKRKLLGREAFERTTSAPLAEMRKRTERDLSPKRPGENREQYRARIHGKVTA